MKNSEIDKSKSREIEKTQKLTNWENQKNLKTSEIGKSKIREIEGFEKFWNRKLEVE